mmetsp:Transcript_28965/g.69249  ORF Transcript_28965/g.69249 Transcript_28965/m.69249 type:complete len:401 (-) Transcript_28965:348-1550(-)
MKDVPRSSSRGRLDKSVLNSFPFCVIGRWSYWFSRALFGSCFSLGRLFLCALREMSVWHLTFVRTFTCSVRLVVLETVTTWKYILPVSRLMCRFGRERVVPSDVRTSESASDSTCVYCDVQDKDGLTRLVLENEITTIVHLASVLSAVGERNPQLALRVNTNGIQNVLDIAAAHGLQVFAPSTIAVFGPSTPRHGTPDAAVKEPRTMYGITKVHQELLGAYYTDKFGVDFRSLRYPGIVSSKSMPGGGTTDYAVDIFHAALRTGKYVCFLGEETALPMVYMPDCLEGTLRLMTAPKEALTQTTYNVASMSFTPRELAESIRRFIPGFELRCLPDFREEIARSWPASIDDSRARRDWGWSPEFDLDAMTAHMLHEISNQMSAPGYGAKPDRGSRLSAAVAG